MAKSQPTTLRMVASKRQKIVKNKKKKATDESVVSQDGSSSRLKHAPASASAVVGSWVYWVG